MTTTERKPIHKRWSTVLAALFALLMIILPIFISEQIGGWSKKYTSPIGFSTASIPDMNGKVAIVTGANTGIGYHTALELVRKGAYVIVAARSPEKGRAAVAKIEGELKDNKSSGKATFLSLDLASLDSVENFATEFLSLELPLHVIVLNAGVMKSPGAAFVGQELSYGFETTNDGFEYHIGVNYIAHAYLTDLLLPKLKESAPSRVVSVSSMAEMGAYEEGMRFEDWSTGGKMPIGYEDGRAYGQSKLANLMWANELAKRNNGTGVTAYACHPGVIITELMRYMDSEMAEQTQENGIFAVMLSQVLKNFFNLALFTAKDGALTQLHLATAPEHKLENGKNYHPIGKVTEPNHALGRNDILQTALWEETEKAIRQRSEYKKE